MKIGTAIRPSMRVALGLTAGLVLLTAPPAAAQWSQAYEQFYLPAKHNWKFRQNFRTADRLFNAFDYGHAILYETLYARPDAPPSLLEDKEYDFITKKLLVRPPRVPLEESAIEIEYAKLAPEAKIMFDWAHILHRQLYDVLADERLSREEQDRAAAELIRYYKSRPDIAFSSIPKTMQLMEGQYYSTVFRQRYPKFNGLIWAYHWLQIGLYEPLLTARSEDEKQTAVTATVARFWQMLEEPPNRMPRIMPMTTAVAPEFARRYPEAAIIFDNLHSMHDVVSDILASPDVPRNRKREEILRAAARYRDGVSFVMSEPEWREMAVAMGLENQGGPAVGFLPPLPEGTVERGAVMAGMQPGAMPGMEHQHPAAAPQVAPGRPADAAAVLARIQELLIDLYMVMGDDPAIQERVKADASLRGLLLELINLMPEEHYDHLRSLIPALNPPER
ncbi:MAG: hypothetical protein HY701_02110 [Gemmatimonadetes bacterium]|nr:hypothetical protein [Gemmatimonadota bacterium]